MMHKLQLSALGAALSLLVVLAPVLFLGLAYPGEQVLSLWDRLLLIAGVPLALVSGFVFVFLFGARMIRSAALRLAGGVLLTLPMCMGAYPLLSGHTEFLAVALPLLVFSLVLFSAFVFPVWLRSAPGGTGSVPRKG